MCKSEYAFLLLTSHTDHCNSLLKLTFRSLDPSFDQSDLTFFRTAVINRSLLPSQLSRRDPRAPPPIQPKLPAPLISYSHDDQLGCSYSSTPDAIILSKSAVKTVLSKKLNRLAELRGLFIAWENPNDKNSHAELLGDVKVGYLGMAIFFRRCNGQYVNAVGDYMGVEAVKHITAAGRLRKLDQKYDTDGQESVENDETTTDPTPSAKCKYDVVEPADLQLTVDCVEKPNMTTAVLRAREEMVHEGHVSKEDLIITCWCMNNQALAEEA